MHCAIIAHPSLLTDFFYFPEVLGGFRSVFQDSGIEAGHFSDDIVTKGELKPGVAVAFLLTHLYQIDQIEELQDRGHPVVAINNYVGHRPIPQIYIDDASGVGEALDYLVSLGHRQIGFLKGLPGNMDAELRLEGFRAGVRRHGITVAPEAGLGFLEEHGYEAAKELLATVPRPTAIISASDLTASATIRVAREAGLLVPLDLSVIGYGDFPIPNPTSPAMTTIRQCRFELGQAAAHATIRLHHGKPIKSVMLKTKLIIRESTTRRLAPLSPGI